MQKKIVNKLVEKSTKNTDEVKIAEITLTENMHKYSSCTLYIVLFSIIFTINIGIATILFATNTLILMKKLAQEMIMSIKQQIVKISGKF